LNVNLVNEQDNEESALTIAGKKRKLKRQDFIQLGTSYDLNETQISNILDREKELSDFIERSFLTDAFKARYREILKNRCHVLSKNSWCPVP
jgi:serine/threonine-protein kinase HipA